MTKEVLINICGLQFENASSDDEMDRIETIYPGEYYFRGNTHFILYEELDEESKTAIKTMIKVKENEVSISKRGLYPVSMIFQKDKQTMSDYATPFGNILIGFDTKEMKMDIDENLINIHIEYGLEANSQFVAECKIDIKVKAINS